MNILIIDAQGGGIGRQLTASLKQSGINAEITAVGTNTAATTAMIKAGADYAATGENAVVVASRKADIITGPIGIVIADSLYGEITPAMAVAVAQSRAVRVLIPYSHCDNIIIGSSDKGIGTYVELATEKIINIISSDT